MNLFEMFNGAAKKTLREGGNLNVGGHEAQQIDLKVHNRAYIVPVLNNLLQGINNAYQEQYQTPLWDPKLLQSRAFLSGSSLHFFNTDIPDDEFVRVKPKVGDIDTQVNKEYEETLNQFLTASKGKVIGNAKLLGHQRGNEQYSSLWELTDPPIKVQIDLEFVAFDKKGPTPWSQFSHSSSWDDLQAGVKGVFHKFLIQAFTTLTSQDFLLQKSVGRGANKTVQHVPTRDNMFSFAVSSKEGGGLRAKYQQVMDERGKPLYIDGLPVMQPLPAQGYEQDLTNIFATIFGERAKKPQVKKLLPDTWSFTGLLKIMNAVMSPEEKQEVLNGFIEKIFGKGAQGLYRNDPDRDITEKNTALNLMLKTLGVQAPPDLEEKRQAYKAGYKMATEGPIGLDKPAVVAEAEAPNYKRQGIQHIYAPGSSTEMKDLEFVEMCKEIAQNGGKLDGMAINLKADGAGIRFGKDEAGRPFFMTSKVTEPKYAENIGDFEQFGLSQGQSPERLAFTKKYDDAMSIILNSDFIKTLPNDTIVQAEMMYNDMAQQTPQGLKFVNIPYDQKKLGKTMTLVPFMFKTFSTGESRPDADAIKKKLLSMSGNDIKFVNNQLEQKGIDVSKIIAPVVNMDQNLVAALASRTRNNPDKEQAKQILTQARQQLSQAIIENPNIKGKDQLGDNIEGLVVNLPSGRLAKVTSQLMKDTMAAKKAAPAAKGPSKTAVVAVGSFVGHKGHQELFKLTINKAKELGGDPFLFMGNAVGKDDPIPVADKIKTWQQLYPQYSNNISATMQGGSLMQKIKHELINPMPGQPPKYDNIVIMVGEDQANMPIANALMKAVNKFPGYEHVKAQLEVTPRGTGMSFTQLRNALKSGDDKQAFALWNDAFNGGNFGAKQLPSNWIKHLMDVSKKGMGIVQQQPQAGVPMAEMRLFNALTMPQLTEGSMPPSPTLLNETPTIDFIRGLISEFNKQMSGSPYYPLDYKNPGMRMWTRGDGSKYKDPGYIFIERDLKPEDIPKWKKAGAIEKFWKFLESKGARKIGDVSGEFGSDPHSPAVVLNKLIFVFNGISITWGSTSRLKNSGVWRQKQQGVAEEDSKAMAHTAKSLENPPKVMQHRAKRDQEREEQLKSRNIVKKNEAMLPKSAFTGSDKNKLGAAGQLKGTAPKEQPTHKLVGETDKKKGADGKACWKGYKYAGTKNGKDKCVPIGEAWEIEMAKAVLKLFEGKK